MSKRYRFRSVLGHDVILGARTMFHILARHPELRKVANLEAWIRDAIEEPKYVVRGVHGEHIAIRPYRKRKYLVVPYQEEGEVKTAFITSKVEKILRRGTVWRR